ncbi:26S proteasome subunit RPN7-domain-containing protein [Polychytrium aggregatum]|uniref:26S proteasome subunit RPN7-domain-containing protein n=1 Tax=Polychytrium aggregatum TaxID=110093 RepID=UPI0022FDEFAE|nr:26S proteasome subunit RPN7-domain-containing protein [Polychytrium aggregatum]KAI9199707.1 26S proteasome subunit RPN7-domain-containing protein [Polychytrium aggregatum]
MEEAIPKIPNLELAQYCFSLSHGLPSSHAAAQKALMDAITANDMAPFYQYLIEKLKWAPDAQLLAKMKTANDAELARLQEKLEDAEANLGETEISDALTAKAFYLTKIGEKDKAVDAYTTAFSKTGPLGQRIDILFATIRIGFFFDDKDLVSRKIGEAKRLIEEGGDWDRRNRLKAYEGIYKLSIRDFKGAVNQLIDTLATFTSTELMDYKEFVRYTVLAATLILPRPDYKKKIIDSPEVLEVIHEINNLSDFANSIYTCDYARFFQSLATIEQEIKYDRILAPHYRYYVREMRILAYAQLLESYRSLTIESLANSFGVSQDYIDSDLSKFIAAGRLNAVIDKVGGIVETNRPDAKNAQYQSTIKQGDLLLNRIQKLSRVISL